MHSRVCLAAAFAALLLFSPAQAEVGGKVEAGKAKAGTCAGCHGIDGNGGGDPALPKLAAQIPEYLVEQLQSFKAGERKNPVMMGMAAPLSEQDMRDLAAYYASLELKPGAATNEELARTGEEIYRGGIAETSVPACIGCHGPAGHGIPPRFPRVNGQAPAYTAQQLVDFKAGRRKDDDGVMARVAGRMSDAQIKAVAEYLAGLH